MNRRALKHLGVLSVVLLGALLALPSFYPVDPALIVGTEDGSAFSDVAASGRAEAAAPPISRQISAALEEAAIVPLSLDVDEQGARLRFANLDDQRSAADILASHLEGAVVAFDLEPRLPAWLRALGLEPVGLGLDLRGGVHFVYDVDLDAVAQRLLETYAADVRAALRDARIRASAAVQGASVAVELERGEDTEAALDALRRMDDPFGTGLPALVRERVSSNGRPVLDLEIPGDVIEARKALAMEQNVATLRNRVDALGVSEPVVQQQGANEILVEVPGVQDPAQLDRVLGSTATLEWRLVDTAGDVRAAALGNRSPPGSILRFESDGTPRLLQRQVIASGEHLTSATFGYSDGRPAIFIRLGGLGASRMLAATQANVGKPLAVLKIEETRVPDAKRPGGFRTKRAEEVVFVGRIDGVFSSQFRLTGGFTATEAQDLALVLRSGALAAPLAKDRGGTIGPSLGQDNVERGRRALIVGFVAVTTFMAAYYRGFGLIADVALLANLLLTIGLLALLGASLTLPGMAGIVLSLGMAVDANVLIIERIREELGRGRSLREAIRLGYDKAWSSIADANVTTLIAGIVLLGLGSGPIKNFAVTLSLGVLTSMFTAVAGTRTIVEVLYERRRKAERLTVGRGR